MACFIGGFLLGMVVVAITWSKDEKRAVRRGFIEVDGNFYRLTRVNMCDFMEDVR